MDSSFRCQQCGNCLSQDIHTGAKYCKSFTCQGRVVEPYVITYEQEVNLHESDDAQRKATRFGGYESKTDAFRDTLSKKLELNKDQKKKFYEKLSNGEAVIEDLCSHFRMEEAFKKEVFLKFRQHLFNSIVEMKQKGIKALATVIFELLILEKKNAYKDDKKLNKITQEHILMVSKVNPDQIQRITELLKIKQKKQTKHAQPNQLIDKLIKAAQTFKYKFSEDELRALQQIPQNLMDQNFIKGEKDNTIISVCMFIVMNLSDNIQLSTINVEDVAEHNQVTKDTVKKLWNSIVQSELTDQHIPPWKGRKPLQYLRSIL